MALPEPITMYGAVLEFNSIAFEDHIVDATITMEPPVAETTTWGGEIVAVGNIKGSGSGTVVYDETAGSPYQTLKAAFLARTSYAMTYQPKGAGSGNDEWTMTAIITKLELGGAGEDMQLVPFDFKATNISNGTQS